MASRDGAQGDLFDWESHLRTSQELAAAGAFTSSWTCARLHPTSNAASDTVMDHAPARLRLPQIPCSTPSPKILGHGTLRDSEHPAAGPMRGPQPPCPQRGADNRTMWTMPSVSASCKTWRLPSCGGSTINWSSSSSTPWCANHHVFFTAQHTDASGTMDRIITTKITTH